MAKMERREAIKYMTLSIGSVISLPAWASSWKNENVKSFGHFLNHANQTLLQDIVDTFIPATNTKGAKSIGVADFVESMVMDCYDKKAIQIFTSGLKTVDDLSKKSVKKSFSECLTEQKLTILKEIGNSSDKETKDFYSLVKNLTIQGYLNSEYVMTNLIKFEMVPSRFHGCVPVNKK